jgi:putative transposase
MMKIIAFISSYIITWLRLLPCGGVRAIAAENIVLRQQLITLSRKHKRAPRLTFFDKITFGILTSMMSVKRLQRIAVIIKPTTLLKFHKALVNRKYSLLFSNTSRKKPGPKGPEQSIIDLILEMKKRNPSYGCRRIAMQISNTFGILIDKDIVRRVLSKHYKHNPEDTGPSWLTFIGHMKDSLWSIDLFCCESILLKTHWVLVIIDQFTRRIISFSVHQGDVTGINLCCMFNTIIFQKSPPKYLSSDNDPLFEFHRWQANLRILNIEEIKSVPYVPTSHPFVERLIGTVRRELLDKTLYWSAHDLQNKLDLFQRYYNIERCHWGIDGIAPLQKAEEQSATVVSINQYKWKKHCRGLFQLPIAA